MITLTTNFGDIEIELNLEKAPVTSEKLSNTAKTVSMKGTTFYFELLKVSWFKVSEYTIDMTEKAGTLTLSWRWSKPRSRT